MNCFQSVYNNNKQCTNFIQTINMIYGELINIKYIQINILL